jgi:hypothetical protein
MHRNSANMGTNCDLCHKDGDDDNPFIGASNGTTRNPGLGCVGCHEGVGLRAHHTRNGVTECAGCHQDGAPPPEGTKPVYYGTPDTRANNAANGVQVANTNENWSVGDFLGLDNDGDNLYDLADFDCGPPYRLLSVETQGADLRITWETVGGRTDLLEVAGSVAGTYRALGAPRIIGGVGLVTTNYLEAGGATNPARFYRVKSGL